MAEDGQESAKRKKESDKLSRERWIKNRADAALFSALSSILIAIVWPEAHAVALTVMALLGFAAVGLKILGSQSSETDFALGDSCIAKP